MYNTNIFIFKNRNNLNTTHIFAKEVIAIITVEEWNSQNDAVYKPFLVDRINDGGEDFVAYGAKCGNIPCGAIYARLEKSDVGGRTQANVTSFFVASFFREKGAGTALLDALKLRLKDLNVDAIRVNAVTSQENVDLIDKFLQKRGFSPARLLTEVYLFDPKVLVEKNKIIKSALQGSFDLPPKISFLPKNLVSPDLLEKVKNKDGIDYPDVLSPFANEFNLDDECTQFAIFDDSEIVGWVTAFRVKESAILYRSLFIREDYRKKALGFALLGECIKKHVAKYSDKMVLYAVALDNLNARKLFSVCFKHYYKSKKYEFEAIMDLRQGF